MADLAVSGIQLKKLIKKTKKAPLSFGFNPASAPENSVMTMSLKKKAPKALGKEAKDLGEGSKVAFGTASLDGKILKLMVERTLPALAKNVKKFLKFNKIMLNVEIYDESGNLLESDVEDNLPDDPDMEGSEDDVDLEEVSDDDEDAVAAEADDPMGPLHDRYAGLTVRWHEMPNAQALEGPFAKVQALIDAGNAAASTAGMDKLEAAMARIAAPSAETAPGGPPTDMRALMARFSNLKTGVGAVPNEPVRARLIEALKGAAGLLKDGNLDGADAAMTRIKAALDKLGTTAQPNTAPAPPPAPSSAPAPEVVSPAEAAKADTQRRMADLKTDLGKLKTFAPEGLTDLLGELATFQQLVKAGSYEQAADLMDEIELEMATMLPPSNVGFQKLRLRWLDAKKAAASDIDKLRKALLAEFSDPDSTKSADRLDEILERFNEGLADTLDLFNSAEAGNVRVGHKDSARAIVTEYLNFLAGSPLVNHAENNPFIPISLRVTLTQPLLLLDAELAKAGA